MLLTRLLSPLTRRLTCSLTLRHFSTHSLPYTFSTSVHNDSTFKEYMKHHSDASHANKTVGVAISGGVDSALTAWILKQQGYNTVGIHMRNWDELDETGVCSGDHDARDAAAVCRTLGIPFHELNLTREYWQYVFEHMMNVYSAGYTPNPDVLCNREIKFHFFWNELKNRFGVDYIATGHYARLFHSKQWQHDTTLPPAFHQYTSHNTSPLLCTGLDPRKDQSYFLSLIRHGALDRALFPLGSIHKPYTRTLARNLSLPVAAKKDSMGVCFIGKRNFGSFLQQYLKVHPGLFRDTDGTVLGRHKSFEQYTIGQNAAISGQTTKYYVYDKDPVTYDIYVCPGRHHPALLHDDIYTTHVNWIQGTPPAALQLCSGGAACSEPVTLSYRIRSMEARRSCTVTAVPLNVYRTLETHHHSNKQVNNSFPATTPTPAAPSSFLTPDFDSSVAYRIRLHEPHNSIARGQNLVLYDGDICLGGGIIDDVGPSYMKMGKAAPKHIPSDPTAVTAHNESCTAPRPSVIHF